MNKQEPGQDVPDIKTWRKTNFVEGGREGHDPLADTKSQIFKPSLSASPELLSKP